MCVVNTHKGSRSMKKKRVNIYGWTDDHDAMLQTVFERLRSQGIPVDHNGEPNASAILLYLLEKAAREKRGKK